MMPDPKHEQKRKGRSWLPRVGMRRFLPLPIPDDAIICGALPGVLIQCTKNLGCAKGVTTARFKGMIPSPNLIYVCTINQYIYIYSTYIYLMYMIYNVYIYIYT